MTTTFNVRKNVTENYSITIPGFTETATNLMRINDAFGMAVAAPSLAFAQYTSIALTSPDMSLPAATVTKAGPSSATYTTTAGDCGLIIGLSSSFSTTSTTIGVGASTIAGDSYLAWFPFESIVAAKSATIVSATIHFICGYSSPFFLTANLKIGCENTGSAVEPTDYNDLNLRAMTNHFTSASVTANWTAGTTYSFDVTSAVQDVINNAAWDTGHTLAVMVRNGGNDGGRLVAAFENSTYGPATLTITQ